MVMNPTDVDNPIIKLIDFGVCQFFPDFEEEKEDFKLKSWQGKRDYMSPEVFAVFNPAGKPVPYDARKADVWYVSLYSLSLSLSFSRSTINKNRTLGVILFLMLFRAWPKQHLAGDPSATDPKCIDIFLEKEKRNRKHWVTQNLRGNNLFFFLHVFNVNNENKLNRCFASYFSKGRG